MSRPVPVAALGLIVAVLYRGVMTVRAIGQGDAPGSAIVPAGLGLLVLMCLPTGLRLARRRNRAPGTLTAAVLLVAAVLVFATRDYGRQSAMFWPSLVGLQLAALFAMFGPPLISRQRD